MAQNTASVSVALLYLTDSINTWCKLAYLKLTVLATQSQLSTSTRQ